MPRWGTGTKEILENLNEPDDKFSLKHMLYVPQLSYTVIFSIVDNNNQIPFLLCRFLSNLCEKYSSDINSKTQEIMVETLRQLSELILWGDQHDPQFFE